jgi:transcriptional regulator with XRE-family HTH domain
MTTKELILLCRERRVALCKTQKELAESIGIARERITEFESGRVNFCTETLLLLLNELNLTICLKTLD